MISFVVPAHNEELWIVAPIAAGSPEGWTHALAWINAKKEIENIAGWATLSAIASIRPDVELDLDENQRLLDEVERTIHTAKDAVRYPVSRINRHHWII